MTSNIVERNGHVWVIIMAGGLGSRFWPISKVDSPKQFIDIMGTGKTMLQATCERFAAFCGKEHIVVVTGAQYVGRVREQVDYLEEWQVLGEPLRRNTAPCIAYAASVIKRRDSKAVVVVSPSDHAIFQQEHFYSDLSSAVDVACQHPWIVTFGAQPTRPDTSYGYIQFDDRSSIAACTNLHPVITFTEKPPIEMARQFIASGEFYWNTGLLVWTLPVLEAAYSNYLPTLADSILKHGGEWGGEEIRQLYSTCEAMSIDRGIMEKADNVHVMSATFGWSDVETWDSLYDVSPRSEEGNAVLGSRNIFAYDTHNCLVALPHGSQKTVVLEGLEGYIVAESDDVLMICRRQHEDMVFKFSSDVDLKRMMEHK